MKIQFAGVGAAFSSSNLYQSNVVLEQNGKRLLIDCGGDIRFSLSEMGLASKDIDAIFITHTHADHIGGVEYFAFSTFFDPSCKEKIKLFGNSKVLSDLWNYSLKGGLRSIQGMDEANLSTYFDVMPCKINKSFEWEGIKFRPIQTVHIMSGTRIMPNYGLFMEELDSGVKAFFTGDTQFTPSQIEDFYNMADIIFHDCEVAPFPSGVHAHYKFLKTLPEETKKKMVLYHYQDNYTDYIEQAQQDGFWGFAKREYKFDLSSHQSLEKILKNKFLCD
jgi:ribonuclease BN (tRNA processing enzyme)